MDWNTLTIGVLLGFSIGLLLGQMEFSFAVKRIAVRIAEKLTRKLNKNEMYSASFHITRQDVDDDDDDEEECDCGDPEPTSVESWTDTPAGSWRNN